MTSVRFLPVAEQYPSSTATSSESTSTRISVVDTLTPLIGSNLLKPEHFARLDSVLRAAQSWQLSSKGCRSPWQFGEAVPCSYQGVAKRKEEFAHSSCGHFNPDLDIKQRVKPDATCSHVDISIVQNQLTMKPVKQIMAERMEHLMRMTPALDTLKKVEAKSGVSYGSVRRVRVADEVDVSISQLEKIAHAFGLSLTEFMSDPGSNNGMSADEIILLQKFRELDDKKDRDEVLFLVSNKVAFSRMKAGEQPSQQ